MLWRKVLSSLVFRNSAFAYSFIEVNNYYSDERFIGILDVILVLIFSLYIFLIYSNVSFAFVSLINSSILIPLLIPFPLISSKYFLIMITYYFPVMLFLDNLNLYYYKLDLIFIRNSILLLINYGRILSIIISDKFFNCFSSDNGFING
jgi:hypothetical protein